MPMQFAEDWHMASVSGRRMSLSPPRRLICDLMRAANGIPIITFERRMDLSPVMSARESIARAPSWAVLFLKAFALVAARRPELRRAYLPLPWPHLWEADFSSASVAVEREYEGEPCVFFGVVNAPENRTLSELVAILNEWKTQPVKQVHGFRRSLRYASYPLLVRRFLWWYACSWSGKVKARNFGTFGVSLTGSSGASATNLICPLTASLNCGVIQPDGTVDVRLHFDHRVMDGMPAARALAEIEDVLRTEIVAEMLAMSEAVHV
jgi:hypothetical protein